MKIYNFKYYFYNYSKKIKNLKYSNQSFKDLKDYLQRYYILNSYTF